jgi:hypothetical protein
LKSSLRSRHSGLRRSTKAIFLSLRQAFHCFSRAMALRMLLKGSKYTSFVVF